MIRKTTKSCFFAVLASFATELAASDLNSESPKLHVVEDFEGKNATSDWMTVNDNVMGGCSKGGFSIKRGKLLFSGSANTNGGGFSSIRMKPNQLALAGKDGIIIRSKVMVELTNLMSVWAGAQLLMSRFQNRF